jgi:hypothetical protein
MINITNICVSQTYLTNSQVFNFDIGDIIQGRYFHAGNNNYTYETKTIIDKVISTNSDSIFYTIKLDYYLTPLTSCNSCTPSTNSTVITQTITNLNQPAINTNSTSACHGTMDSIYTDYCNKTVWGKFPTTGVGCGPGQDRQETYMVSGLGGPYYNYVTTYNPMLLKWIDYRLTYYSKASGTCGSLITTSVNEKKLTNFNMSIYPNPSTGALFIKSTENIYFYDIVNLNGQVIKACYLTSPNIDVSFLSSGNYLINLFTIDNKIAIQKFCIE